MPEFGATVVDKALKGIGMIRFDDAGRFVEFGITIRPFSVPQALGSGSSCPHSRSAAEPRGCRATAAARSARELRVREPAKAPDAVLDAFVPHVPCTQAQAVAEAPAGGENVARREADALFERGVEQRA